MARKQEQNALPGIPGPEKRKTIAALEELAETLDKQIQAALVQHDLTSYIYEDADGVERELFRHEGVKRRKAKTKSDGAKEAA